MKKTLTLLLIVIITILLLPKTSKAIVEPTTNFYVNDYADILSQETEDFIMNNSVALAKKTSAQIVVVTIPSLEKKSIEEYANELFNKFGIGDKNKNNGLLILVALKEREARIEVGYGLEGLLPDGKCGRYQDEYMIPYYKNNNFDEGTVNCYKAFFAEIAKEYNYETDIIPVGTPLEEVNNSYENQKKEQLATYLFIGKIFTFFTILSFEFKKKKTKIIVFSILESITALITYLSYISGAGSSALFLLIFGTIFNLLAVFVHFNFIGIGGGYHGGGFSSGRSYSSGGGFHGGGGHSGGGGSSRHF